MLLYDVVDAQDLMVERQMNLRVDKINAKLDRIELIQEQSKELLEHRLGYLEKQRDDHLVIIQAAAEGIIQFRARYGLFSMGSDL